MKKIAIGILALTLALAFAGCGKEPASEESTVPVSESTVQQETTAPTEAPTEAPMDAPEEAANSESTEGAAPIEAVHENGILSIHELVILDGEDVTRALVGHSKDELVAAWGPCLREETGAAQWDAEYGSGEEKTPYGGIDIVLDENNMITEAYKYKISGRYNAGVEWYQEQKQNQENP